MGDISGSDSFGSSSTVDSAATGLLPAVPATSDATTNPSAGTLITRPAVAPLPSGARWLVSSWSFYAVLLFGAVALAGCAAGYKKLGVEATWT